MLLIFFFNKQNFHTQDMKIPFSLTTAVLIDCLLKIGLVLNIALEELLHSALGIQYL